MRDILFRNFTSPDQRKKVLSSSEVMEQNGIQTVIHRHFICLVNSVVSKDKPAPLPKLYVFKYHNSKEQKEKFLCRFKGSLYALSNGHLFLISFVHSLKIDLSVVSEGASKNYS